MNRTLLRLCQTSLLVVFAYALVYSRELPKVVAAVDTTCDSDLDQADTIYQLTGNTVGNCIITANNVTIDGQGLYSVSGDVLGLGNTPGAAGFDLSLMNITVTGDVNSRGADNNVADSPGGAGGDISITNATIEGRVFAWGGAVNSPGTGDGGAAGDVTIDNSIVLEYVSSSGGYSRGIAVRGGAAGDITITDSEIGEDLGIDGYAVDNRGGGSVAATSGHGADAGVTTIIDSVIHRAVFNFGGNARGGGFIAGNSGEIIINRSSIGTTDLYGAGTDFFSIFSQEGFGHSGATAGGPGQITITDSSIESNILAVDEIITIIDNPPTLTVTPLEIDLDFNDTFDNDFGTVSASDIKDGNLTSSIVASGTVSALVGIYEIEYSVTDLGTTLLLNSVSTSTASSTVTATRTVTRLEPQSSSSGTSAGGRAKKLKEQGKTEEAVALEERFDIVSAPTPTPAPVSFSTTLDKLRSELKDIIQTYKDLTGIDLTPVPLPVRDLTIDDTGSDVKALQQLLINLSYGIPAGATGTFGTQTETALASYQRAHNITPALGYFGSKTRAEMKSVGQRVWW